MHVWQKFSCPWGYAFFDRPQVQIALKKNAFDYGADTSASAFYAYVNNDPLNRIDPTGLAAEQIGSAVYTGLANYSNAQVQTGEAEAAAGQALGSYVYNNPGTVANIALTAASLIPSPIEPEAAALRGLTEAASARGLSSLGGVFSS